ncbi:MAG TPA: hypothetical protein VGH28_09215 [Polyangiaceae bacterium]|jgi:hypothetical protein
MLISRSIACLIFVVACGGKIGPDGPGDAAADGPVLLKDASPPTPVVDASLPTGECTDLDVVGQSTTVELVPEEAPPFAATGGSLAEGIYQLTSIIEYTGPNGAGGTGGSIDDRIRITSAKNGWNIESVATTDQQADQRSAATATSAGNGELLVTQYCPDAGPATATLYSFDGATLTLRIDAAEEQFTLVTK